MSLNIAKRLALFCLVALTALPAQGTFISEDEWEGDPNTAPSLHKYLYSYQNPTVYVDPDGRAPVLAEMTNGLFSQADYINQRSIEYRNKGGLSGHFAATMMNVGAGVHNVLGGAVGLVNTVADVGIAGTAGHLESAGVEFQEYGVVADSRAHLKNVGASIKQAGNTLANIDDRDVRAELGRGGVETVMGAINGDPVALNNFATGISTVGTGGAISKVNPYSLISNATPNSSPSNNGSGSNVSLVTENSSGISSRVDLGDNTNGSNQSWKYANRTNVQHRAANEVNLEFQQKGWAPPYQQGTRVTEYVTKADDQFVPVHGEGNQARSWMMRQEAIAGLDASQIQRKYSLPNKPQYISDVNVPANTPVRTGKVEPNFELQGGGGRGATQYELLERIDQDNFQNKRLIDENE